MHATPRNPLCAPIAAALGTLSPAEAARWADLLAQHATDMAPVERRARLALRICLLQRSMQTPPEAPSPEAAPTAALPPQDAAPDPAGPQSPVPEPSASEAGSDGPLQPQAPAPEPAQMEPPAASPPPTPQRRRKRRPAPDAIPPDGPQT